MASRIKNEMPLSIHAKLLFSASETMALLGLTRSKYRAKVRNGELGAVRDGARIKHRQDHILRYVRSLKPVRLTKAEREEIPAGFEHLTEG